MSVIDRSGDADSSSLCETLNSGSYVYPITIDTLSLLHHIAKVDTYAKVHPAVFRQLSVPNPEFLLDLHGTPHRIHYTAKFCQKIIPRGVHHPSTVLLYEC